MKNKKTIIIIIIIAIIVAFISINLISDYQKENKIKEEVREISRVINVANIDDDEVNEVLTRRIIKKGKYKEVEDSIKNYYQTVYSDIKNLTFLLDDDNFSLYLTSDNLNEDKPLFQKSKATLTNTKAQIEEYYNKLSDELNNEDTKMSYIIDKNVSTYYNEFYLELTSLAINDEFKEDLTSTYESTLSKINIYNDVLDFLIANKGHWSVQNEVIIFDDTILYEEYTNITNKLKVSQS